ncbi:hypothetical protein [Micromonospora sp. NPDC005220]|uniref:hypothetical protein n=1 Tax=Micromonospora sp. NPDC005220 TaxID=3155589 RepID=UPI0033B27E57
MKLWRSTAVATALLTGAVLVPGLPAAAAPIEPATADTGMVTMAGGSVSVLDGALGIANQIFSIVQEQVRLQINREGLVRALRETAWYKTGEKHNIIVMVAPNGSWEGRFSCHLVGKVSDAVYRYPGYPPFRVVAFSHGTVKNEGEGGYINWAYRGWFDRNGMTVHFRKP